MECNKFGRISRKLIDKNPYWNYYVDEYILPNGNIGKYYHVETNGSVMIVPILENGLFLMTKQYRYLDKRYSYEFPGGGVKSGKTLEEAARAELIEETGAIPSEIVQIGMFNPFNGVTSEICNVFYAKISNFVEQHLDESEEIEIMKFSLDDIVNMIRAGEIYDGMTISAFSIYYVSHILAKK